MSYEANTIVRFAKLIADDLERKMEYWVDRASEEKRDGREMLVGPLFFLIRVARAVGVTKEQLVSIIRNTDAFDVGGKISRDASLLIAPNGRPLAKVG